VIQICRRSRLEKQPTDPACGGQKSTDMALIAKYRTGEPNRPPVLIPVFRGELSLVVRPIHKGSPFQNHRYSNPRVPVKLLGFNCSK
jgi:hypothetical protein